MISMHKPKSIIRERFLGYDSSVEQLHEGSGEKCFEIENLTKYGEELLRRYGYAIVH